MRFPAGAVLAPLFSLLAAAPSFAQGLFDDNEARRRIEAVRQQLLENNRQFKMLIQGNTDERGSREYNIALGQKRADAVKKALVLLGAREDQVESVSLGEEKPSCVDQSEACWAKNRRGDMLYSGEF